MDFPQLSRIIEALMKSLNRPVGFAQRILVNPLRNGETGDKQNQQKASDHLANSKRSGAH